MTENTLKSFAVAAVLGLVAVAPANAQSARVNVTPGPHVAKTAEALGQREVDEQIGRLAFVVEREMAKNPALQGAVVDLVLVDLKPNRPTFEQLSRQPGLDGIRSRSIGGAEIEGRITTADGRIQPVRAQWFSTSIAEVRGYSTWHDAENAYRRLANNIVRGRFVTR